MNAFVIYVLFITGPNAGQVQYVTGPGSCYEAREQTKKRVIQWNEVAYVSECFKRGSSK